MKQMKWWGWGDENKVFDIHHKPELWPYIVKISGIDPDIKETTPAIPLQDIVLNEPYLHPDFFSGIQRILPLDNIKHDVYERLIHTYGKSFRDLWRIRNGIITRAPDLVCYPENEEQVQAIIALAHQFRIIIIPFGGGSNIAGCLEPRHSSAHMIVSMDMKKMARVLEVDNYSMTARIQAGVMGPDLEEQLNRQGMTLGHFPDSFEYSSLGGWVATRSAGMKSDKYGKIEDMVIALRMVTPSGILVTRNVPKCSNGIGINQLCVGSEGIFGVITEVTMQVHSLPAQKQFHGYLFPNFEKGAAAIYESTLQNVIPSMTRLNDADKTALSFAFKSKGSFLSTLLSRFIKWYLKKIKKFDFDKVCLLLVGYEGENIQAQIKQANAIYQRFGGFHLGTSPGKAFEKGKYDFPYLRDFIMDRGLSADVSETATPWKNVLPLYYQTKKAIEEAIASSGSKAWVGCHISHTYKTGASLYFTFAFKQSKDVIQQYLQVKKAAEDAFIQQGATLSHHHAVGWEHTPWLNDDISTTGIKAIQGIKASLDPNNIMNPGKMIPGELPLVEWGWNE